MAIENVRQFLEGKTYEDMCNDKLLFYGVVKNIEIIGEAANHVTKDLIALHPEIDWQAMIAMRHVLVHDYYNIDALTAWKTATKDLPSLCEPIGTILKSLQ